jgi:hypothetical protein
LVAAICAPTTPPTTMVRSTIAAITSIKVKPLRRLFDFITFGSQTLEA